MKFVIATITSLCFTASAFAAIEFSEDQVAASTNAPDSSSTSTSGSSSQTSGPMAMTGQTAPTAAMGAMAQGQSSVVPRTPPMMMPPNDMSGMAMGGGGGRGPGGMAGMMDGEMPMQGQEPPTDGGPTDGPGDDGGPDSVPVPEPATLAVWSILGLLGLVAYRRRS